MKTRAMALWAAGCLLCLGATAGAAVWTAWAVAVRAAEYRTIAWGCLRRLEELHPDEPAVVEYRRRLEALPR